MITFKAKDFDYSGNKNRIEGECLSTDTKPTEGIANGSCLIEMDTGDTYAFDETGAGTWRKLSSSGGGGSSLPAVTSDDNGDVLTVVNGAWDKASPSGGGAFIVTFTLDMQTRTATADKTFAEVKSAYDQYQNVIGVVSFNPGDPDMRIPLTGYADANTLIFEISSCMTDGEGAITALSYVAFSLKSDDTATVNIASKQF